MRHFDIAIIGGGLSGLIRADYFSEFTDPNLKIVIVDPNPSKMMEKTFASWILKSDPPHRYSHLVAHRWMKMILTGLNGERLERTLQNHTYEVIPGTSLFQHFKKKLFGDPRFTWLECAVHSVSNASKETPMRLHLDSGESISADRIFNSIVNTHANLFQSFVGVEVQTEESCFNPDSVHLMDFSVPQKGEVRFVYTLPFSEKHALIEYTAFSKQKPEESDLDACLMELIKKSFNAGSYLIIRKESGAIPMDSELEPRFAASFRFSKIESMGAAAHRIKPSTGYSFLRNLEVFKKDKETDFRALRFSFYDRLFLDVVQKFGGRAGDIFFRLFRNNPVDLVFLFLSEKTSFFEELKILLRLPKKPFLTRLAFSRPFFFVVAISLIFEFLSLQTAAWLIPTLGLITIGMAHGSLDVVLSKSDKRIHFIGGYLARILIAVLFWILYPPLAFVLFLIHSSDHFGEAQWIRLIRASGNAGSVRVRAWAWGLFASLFGVLFHWDESIPFIQALLGYTNHLDAITIDFAKTASYGLLILSLWASWSLDRYHLRVYGTLGSGMGSTIGLAISLMALPLLSGFFCFFAFWHGWDTLNVQMKAQKWNMKEYVRHAAPYTLLAYAVILIFVALINDGLTFSIITKTLVITISALTAAHAPAMKRFLFFADSKAANAKASPEPRSPLQ